MRPLSLVTHTSLLGLVVLSTAAAHASTVTVLATDSVYAAGNQAANAPGYGATAPSAINIAAGTSYFTFSATGTVTVNGGGNTNDADGIGSASGEYNSGTSALSGITAPTAGFIAGVFVAANGPSGSVPAALNFSGTGGTSFSSLSPLLNQVFFIGDGLTGDGTGSTQTFYVPTGAGELYLGLTDACGYSGSPSCYGDNSGMFSVMVNSTGSTVPPPPPPPSTVTPEPSSLLLLGTGVFGAAGALRRRLTGR